MKNTIERTPDEIWIKRRQALEACPMRFVADLRQLADEIEEYAEKQREKETKIKELLGIPSTRMTIK